MPAAFWRTAGLAATVAFCSACSATPVSGEAGDALVSIGAGPLRWEQRVASVRARRDAGVVRQQHDYSCGSAALATLLSYGLNESVSEQELLGELMRTLNAEQIAGLQARGLSLEALRQLALGRGHRAQGFRIHQSQLEKLVHPVIVHLRPGGYEHFAVLKRVRSGVVELADPSLGNVRMPLYRFLEMWADPSGYGVLLAVEPLDGAWPDRPGLQDSDLAEPAVAQQSSLRLGRPGALRASANSGR